LGENVHSRDDSRAICSWRRTRRSTLTLAERVSRSVTLPLQRQQ
jgi:hypothetical protein